MFWSDLLSALALVLVIEGILPFLNPNGFKRRLEQVSRLDDRQLRGIGLVVMLSGAVLLYLVRHV
jgi:uncharacterized protein